MIMNLGKVIEMVMSPELEIYCKRACGTARFTYNKIVVEDNKCYEETGKGLKVNSFKTEFNATKRELYPWIYESPKDANQQTFNYYNTNRRIAFNKYKKGGKLELPDFKRKGKCKNSFYVSNDRATIEIGSNEIRLPKFGEVKLKERFFPRQYDVYESKKRHKEHLEYRGFKLINVTISERAGRWYASISYEIEIKDQNPILKKDQALIALDMNVAKYQTYDTNGELIPNPMNANAFKQAKLIKKTNRAFSRAESPHTIKQKPSKTKKPHQSKLDRIISINDKNKQIRLRNKKFKENNINVLIDDLEKEVVFKGREKQKILLRKAHQKLTNIVDDFYKKLALKIVRENQAVCIEDLDLVAMRQNHRVASKFMCASFGKLRKWIEHLAPIYGCLVIHADQYFPSSKQCSSCLKVNQELKFEKTWTCPSCKVVHDRDENSAINLLHYLIDFLLGKNIPEATGSSSSTASSRDNEQIKWVQVHIYAEAYKSTFLNI